MTRPVFLLAFSYNPDAALPEVVNELRSLQQILSDTEGQPEPIWQVTQQDLERSLTKHREDLRIFHYSGHAGPNALQLNNSNGGEQVSFASGLAGLAGMASGLRLVFLNGCSTEDQAQVFMDKGIPAVIATTKPLADRYAVAFARRFYQNFTRANSKLSIKQAFDAAFYAFTGEYGSLSKEMIDERVRGSFDLDEDANEPLYELHIHPAKKSVENERFSDWLVLKSTTDYTALKQELQGLIANGYLEKALEELAKIMPDALQLQAQYAKLKREDLLGILDTDERFKWNNKINYSALELINKIG